MNYSLSRKMSINRSISGSKKLLPDVNACNLDWIDFKGEKDVIQIFSVEMILNTIRSQ